MRHCKLPLPLARAYHAMLGASRLRISGAPQFSSRAIASAGFTAATLVVLCSLLSDYSVAQGILPPKKDVAVSSETARGYVLLGNPVPPSLNVINTTGNTRALLSYKPANDVLVVGFYSTRCPQNQEVWSDLKRVYQDYKGWHATFLGVSVQPDETLTELDQAMSKAGLEYTAVRDDQGHVARQLHVSTTPEIVVIDEYGYLRYRGDLKHVRKALDAIIGHEPLTVDPEAKNLEGCPVL